MLCCFGAGSVLQSSLQLFSTGVASYSVETNYLDWDTPFPAVTICDAATESDQVEQYLKQHKKSASLSQFYKDLVYWNNNKYCKVCGGCKNDTCEENFGHGIKEIRYTCAELLTDCWWGGKYFRCCDIFHPVLTEFGECHVFNSALLGNKSILTVNKVIGLPDLLFSASKTIDLTVHAPDDTLSADYGSICSGDTCKLNFIREFEAIMKVEQTVNDPSVASLPISMRGCLFKEERPSLQGWPFQQYTYSACLLFCRRLAQVATCNCTHHYLADIFGTPACNVTGLKCLEENRINMKQYPCDCPTACDETQYKAVDVFQKRLPKSPEFIKRGSRGRIRLANLPTLRVRRMAIKDTLGLVVDIGGVGGVFFGASLLSVIELVYLFCNRRN
ncbi:sodium channel protein Nach-like isoform X2 [Maniola jurtina]|nr:sodium channel protein Nach-like isoform X2 [Maniola jurtina]